MPEPFEQTRLWQETLACRNDDPHERSRTRLREALLGMRRNAALLARLIESDLPDYTLHDTSHFDGLWTVADLIAGEAYGLTPCEAFVLGCAFLVHDLGMAFAAYPGGREALRTTAVWCDALAAEVRAALGHFPYVEDMGDAPDEIKRKADAIALRELHAERAEELTHTRWETEDGRACVLLEDSAFAEALGPVIGRIAHSHWWSVSALREGLGPATGAVAGLPVGWTVDPLKVACLLRTADAAHLDATRAPVFLRVLRRPEGLSRSHWQFQARLMQPQVRDERLVFTSSPFPLSEAEAWWLCFDTLNTVHAELRDVDQLMTDCGTPRFRARAVAGVEDPSRLAAFVPPEGWVPVDSRIRISDPLRIVRRLGGRELYGDRPAVALRELIQNAADAIRARRILEGRNEDWGQIEIELGECDGAHWLEVRDNGVGMSRAVMAGPLVDFGVSLWSDITLQREFPGLLSGGFRPAGRYGIGFFSAFMLGGAVAVSSRRYDAAQADTHVLAFPSVSRRPVMRQAESGQRLADTSTAVRVYLDRDPNAEGGLLWGVRDAEHPLTKLCQQLYPCIDVNIVVTGIHGERRNAVTANDWLKLDPLDLVRRLSESGAQFSECLVALSENCRPLFDARGQVVGRAWLLPSDTRDPDVAALIVNGMVAPGFQGFAGVMPGVPVTASRQEAALGIPESELARWATEQAELVNGSGRPDIEKLACAAHVLALDGNPGSLPLARLDGELLALSDLPGVEWPDSLAIVNPYLVPGWGAPMASARETAPTILETVVWPLRASGSPVMAALAEAWSCTAEDLARAMEQGLTTWNQVEPGAPPWMCYLVSRHGV